MSYEDETNYLRSYNNAFRRGLPAPDIDVLPPSAAARVTRFLAAAGPARMVARQSVEPTIMEAPPQAVASIGAANIAKLQAFATRLEAGIQGV